MTGAARCRRAVYLMAAALCLAGATAAACAQAAAAADLSRSSAQLSDQSFALLNWLNRRGGSGPLLGPVASFAADAEHLSKSLAQNDLAAAQSALGALESDRDQVDNLLKNHQGTVDSAQWSKLKEHLTRIAGRLPHNPGDNSSGSVNDAMADKGAAPSLPSSDALSSPPRIVVASREPTDDGYRVRGFFEGDTLMSAGIYRGPNRLRAFKVNDVPGKQRVEFDLTLEAPSDDLVLRVTDVDGRTAEAPLVGSLEAPLVPLASDLSVPSATRAIPPAEPGASGAGASEHSATAEIPSHGPVLPSPSKRHTLGARLAGVRIDIAQVSRVSNLPPAYRLVGRIEGRGITRAGIYLDGRLLKAIPIIRGARSTGFDERFVAENGTVTVRAYGLGEQFVESSVDVSDAVEPDDQEGTAAAPVSSGANGIAIQVTGMSALGPNLYLVSGVITGRNIASAGLYQNGVLAQNFNLGGGLGSLLGAVLPAAYRRFNFRARFDPYAGPATIRAFDRAGAYSEQPLVITRVPFGSSPYSAVIPYGSPYRSATTPYYGGSGLSRPTPGLGRPLW